LSGPRPDGAPAPPPGVPDDEERRQLPPDDESAIPLTLTDEPPASGPLSAASGPAPGGGIFSLEGRRAPGLYLVAWLLSVVGLVLLLVIGPLASSRDASLLLVVIGAILLTLGLATACGYQVLERRERSAARYRGPSPLLVFLTYFMALQVIGLVLIPEGAIDRLDPLTFLGLASLQALGYVVVVGLFVVRTDALSWSQMGWPTWQGPGLRETLRAIGEAVAVMLPTMVGMLLLGAVLAFILDVESPSILPTPGTSLEVLAIAAAAGLILPTGEELFFRGFTLTAWLRDLGPRSALLRSSLFFALIHFTNIRTGVFLEGLGQFLLQTAVLLPVGLVLGWLFLRRGMAAAIAGHVTYNSLLLFLSLLAARLPQAT
jgi:membrane protease YdiL (CAAX protease family)